MFFISLQASTHISGQNFNPQTTTGLRKHSSVHTQQPAGPVREVQIDPYIILDDELKYFYDDVRDVSIFWIINYRQKYVIWLAIYKHSLVSTE